MYEQDYMMWLPLIARDQRGSFKPCAPVTIERWKAEGWGATK